MCSPINVEYEHSRDWDLGSILISLNNIRALNQVPLKSQDVHCHTHSLAKNTNESLSIAVVNCDQTDRQWS